MAEQTPRSSNNRETWLVAAWPGMGNVGAGACAHLISQLNAQVIHELPSSDLFDLRHIDVKDGLAKPGRLPRSLFFKWSNPDTSQDLLIFLGEAQPSERGYAFCHQLLDYALTHNIDRVITFAAMATQLHPADDPNIFGIGTTGEQIKKLQALEVTLLKEGEISGLNGVLLAAAAERDLPGMCLLGELPYFAAGVPNPKTSKVVLTTFATMAGLTLDYTEIDQQAKVVERGLIQLLEKLQAQGQDESDIGEEGFTVPEAGFETPDDSGDEDENDKVAKRPEPELDAEARARIESLFELAEKDRSKAVHLQQELDRLGVFKQYEDRFLDLFKKGE